MGLKPHDEQDNRPTFSASALPLALHWQHRQAFRQAGTGTYSQMEPPFTFWDLVSGLAKSGNPAALHDAMQGMLQVRQ